MRRSSLLVVLALVAGCTANRKLEDVVLQGRALLGDPAADQVQDAAWQLRRAKFLANADAVSPVGS